jgi:hypothetical protein
MMVLLAGMGTTLMAADFNGDGTGDIAVFRPSSNLWSVRNVTRIYGGTTGDNPVPGDYNGSGRDQAAIYRSTSGLWAVQDVTRIYFGGGSDVPMPGDYNGDGIYDIGVFRGSAGLWAVNGLTRVYFGGSTDVAISPGKARIRGLLKTGQTFSYLSGDDGYYERGTAISYTDNGDGTITDNVTGLMWAKDGNETGCNFGNQTEWTPAVAWAKNLDFAGHTDWRLPNRRELESLVDISINSLAIWATYFPNTKPESYWSSSTLALDHSRAWYVYFYDGNVYHDEKIDTYYVRAVRGGG